MTTVSIFQSEITDLEAQISAFQSRLALLQKAEAAGAQLLAAIAQTKQQFDELGACAKLRQAVLELFGGSPDPTPEDKKVVQPGDNSEQPKFENFVSEVPPQPETEQLTIEEAIADNELPASPSTLTDQELDKLEEDLVGEQMNYTELRHLTSTLAYFRKYDGEIQAAYLGCNSKKLADAWAKQLILWGCDAEARKVKRLQGEGIAYEVKIRKIDGDRLDKLAHYTRESFRHPDVIASEGKPPKKPQESTSPTTSSPNCDAAKDAIAAVPSVQQNDWQPKVGDKVRIAEMIGEYQVATVGSIYLTARRTTDQMLVTQVLPTECTPVLVDEPEIQFAFRQMGDAISPDYEVFWGTERLGKVWEHLTAGGWNHSLNRNPALSWPTREDAAFSLQLAFENERDLHERTNAQLRKRFGLAS